MTREEVQTADKLGQQGKMILAQLTTANERLLWLEEGRDRKVAFFIRGSTATVEVPVTGETLAAIERVVRDWLQLEIARLEAELAALPWPPK